MCCPGRTPATSRTLRAACAVGAKSTTSPSRNSATFLTEEPRPIVRFPPPPIAWPVQRVLGACPEAARLDAPLGRVLLERRSIRRLSAPSVREVLALVGMVTMNRLVKAGDPFARSRRVSPSAGALHPVSIVVLRGGRARATALRVDPVGAHVQLLREREPGGAARLLTRLPQYLPQARGTMLVLLADRQLTAAAYRSPDSLLWRDAGALLATLQITAAGLGLGTCLLGLLGHEVARSLFPSGNRIVAVGACVVGRPTPPA
ncbi:nitroreductase family protein [Muricoccus vinaceus]|uniref:Nitroreductase family protein n=1 Tax=Muricoccus vinaceus TaxID=424704 RepID=A0ABV6IVJ1_9PROT